MMKLALHDATSDSTGTLYNTDCLPGLKCLDSGSVDCVVTSPPYWGLRDYGLAPTEWPEVTFTAMAGVPAVTIPAMRCCHGLEADPMAYVAHEVLIFREVRRVLKNEGTLWLNLGDSYSGQPGGQQGKTELLANRTVTTNGARLTPKKEISGLKPKNLTGMPWRVALALQADGWILRQDIIWEKPNAMPESVRDRCTKAHEYLFLMTKSAKYHFDHGALREPIRSDKGNSPAGRNRRSVWSIATKPFKEAHFATFPPALIRPCILAGCPEGGVVMDPFTGAGTSWLVTRELERRFIGFELNPDYCQITQNRLLPVQRRLFA